MSSILNLFWSNSNLQDTLDKTTTLDKPASVPASSLTAVTNQTNPVDQPNLTDRPNPADQPDLANLADRTNSADQLNQPDLTNPANQTNPSNNSDTILVHLTKDINQLYTVATVETVTLGLCSNCFSTDKETSQLYKGGFVLPTDDYMSFGILHTDRYNIENITSKSNHIDVFGALHMAKKIAAMLNSRIGLVCLGSHTTTDTNEIIICLYDTSLDIHIIKTTTIKTYNAVTLAKLALDCKKLFASYKFKQSN